MEISKLLEIAKEMAFEGQDIDVIRAKMKTLSKDTDEFNKVMYKTNDFVVEYQNFKLEKEAYLMKVIMGMCIFLLGLGLSIGSYFASGSGYYFIASGAILFGIYLVYSNYKLFQLPMDAYYQNKFQIKRRKRMF